MSGSPKKPSLSAEEQKRVDKALFTAIYNKNIEDVDKFLAEGANINAKDSRSGYIPLDYAVLQYAPAIAMVLIEAGADVNKAGNDGQTPLHEWAGSTSLSYCFNALIEAGADLDATDKDGKTVFDYVDKDHSLTFPEFLYPTILQNLSDTKKATLDYILGNEKKHLMQGSLLKHTLICYNRAVHPFLLDLFRNLFVMRDF